MPYSYRMTSRVLYSAQYHKQHCTLQAFEQLGAPYIHNLDDKYRTRPGFEPSTSEFRATTGPNESHRGLPRNVSVCAETHAFVPHWDLQYIICPNLSCRGLSEVIRCLENLVLNLSIANLFSVNFSHNRTTFRHRNIWNGLRLHRAGALG